MVAKGQLGDIRVGPGRISAGLADRGRSKPPARSRRPGAPTPSARAPAAATGDIGTHAYNLACFVSGLELESSCGRSQRLRQGPRARRQCQHPAALQEVAAPRHDLGEPGGARQRERSEAARLRHQGRARMGAGRPELSLVHAVRPAEAADHPRRRRRQGRRGARDARPARPSGRLSRRLRQHLRRGRPGDPRRAAQDRRSRRRTCIFPTVADGVEGVAFVEACVRSSRKNAAWVPLSL